MNNKRNLGLTAKKIYIYEFPFLPPSVNKLYATNWNSHKRFKSKAYDEFIENVAHYLKPVPKMPINEEIEIEFNFYLPDKRRRDYDNFLKILGDMLKTFRIIKDDSLIKRAVIELFYRKEKPLTVISIKSLYYSPF